MGKIKDTAKRSAEWLVWRVVILCLVILPTVKVYQMVTTPRAPSVDRKSPVESKSPREIVDEATRNAAMDILESGSYLKQTQPEEQPKTVERPSMTQQSWPSSTPRAEIMVDPYPKMPDPEAYNFFPTLRLGEDIFTINQTTLQDMKDMGYQIVKEFEWGFDGGEGCYHMRNGAGYYIIAYFMNQTEAVMSENDCVVFGISYDFKGNKNVEESFYLNGQKYTPNDTLEMVQLEMSDYVLYYSSDIFYIWKDGYYQYFFTFDWDDNHVTGIWTRFIRPDFEES